MRTAGPLLLAAWFGVVTTSIAAEGGAAHTSETSRQQPTPRTTSTSRNPTSVGNRQIAGDVFIVTKGGANYKLGLVTVRAIAEGALKKHLERKRQESEQALAKSEAEIDRINAEWDAAKAEGDRLYQIFIADVLNKDKEAAWKASNAKSAEVGTRYERVLRARMHLSSHEFFYEGLPVGVSTAKTDADGKFTIHIPRAGRFAVAASSSREIGNNKEEYFWLVWVPAGGSSSRLMLSNDNMMGQDSPESAWR